MPFYSITTTKLKRKLSFSNLLIPFKLIKGIIDAVNILKKIKPDIVFSKGGFVAVPVVITSSLLNIPVITHESDYTLGLANKIIKNKCKYVCTSFEDTMRELKNGVFTGSPVREEIYKGNKENIYKMYNFNRTKTNLLFIGGSLGSECINKIVFENVKKLTANYNVLHIVGKNNFNENIKCKSYVQVKSMKNIEDAFDFANVVITRGGANTIFELLAIKKPMIIIPLGKSESRGDQLLNANYFQKNGFANVLLEENLSIESLINMIEKTYKNKQQLINNMEQKSVNGTKNIINLIIKTIKNKH